MAEDILHKIFVNQFAFLVLKFQNSECSAGQFGTAGSVLQSPAVTLSGGHIAAYST
jgi:hypothetical protein